MRRRNLLRVEFQYQGNVWMVLGWMDGGPLLGVLGVLVKVKFG